MSDLLGSAYTPIQGWQSADINDQLVRTALFNTFGGANAWNKLGFAGDRPDYMSSWNADLGEGGPMVDTGWQKFLQDNGYGYNVGENSNGDVIGQLTQRGQTIPDRYATWSHPDNTGWNIANGVVQGVMLGAGAYAGLGADAGYGAGLEEAGNAAASELPSGMDLAADAALGSGNNITTAGGLLGSGASAAGNIANTGSDAHLYQSQAGGAGVQDLGNMGGAGTATVPTMTFGGSSGGLADLLKNGGAALVNNPRLAASLLGGLAGAMGGKSPGASGGGSGFAPLAAPVGSWSPVAKTGGGLMSQASSTPAPAGPQLQNSGLARFGANANPYLPAAFSPATYQAPRWNPGASAPTQMTAQPVAAGSPGGK